jgi:hypothetical protein
MECYPNFKKKIDFLKKIHGQRNEHGNLQHIPLEA